jgi:hypothetical protein
MSAKKDKSAKPATNAVVSTEDSTVHVNEEGEPVLPDLPPTKLTREDGKALFKFCKECEAEISSCEKMVLDLKVQLSNRVHKIQEVFGNGPFKYNGKVVTIESRKKRNSEVVVWSFVEQGDDVQSFED